MAGMGLTKSTNPGGAAAPGEPGFDFGKVLVNTDKLHKLLYRTGSQTQLMFLGM